VVKQSSSSPLLVGGIYTVLRTKAPVTVAEFGSRYCLVGPWNGRSSPLEVEELEPESQLIKKCIDGLRQQGVRVVYGRWLIDGSPYVLLFDLETAGARLSEWRNDLWESASIPCPTSDRDMNDAVLLGYMLSWFLDLVLVVPQEQDLILNLVLCLWPV
jgi:glycogen(starch) synthase